MNADVIIVGAGPSGLTVAAEVAAAGHRVIVLERRTDVVESRAGTFMPRVLELFDARGVADRFIRKAREVRHWPFTKSHLWAGLTPVHWDHLESRYGFTMLMPQNYTEAVLLSWAREKGVDIRMGHEVLGIEVRDDGAEVRVRSADGVESSLKAHYLIGADGTRSVVRKSLDLPFDGHGPSFTGIIADAIMDFPFEGGFVSRDTLSGWGSCFPFGKRIVRFSIVHAEGRRAGKDVPVTFEEVRGYITDIFGSDLGIEGLRWGSRYTDQMRIAPVFGKGRAFLVGESSRMHYPASGVGMNFCIQDAFNLAWKLSYVLSGHAEPRLLDTYDVERRPVALELLESVRTQCAMQFNFTEEGFALKHAFGDRFLPVPEVNAAIGLELSGLRNPYPRAASAHAATGWRAKDIDLVQLDGSVTRLYELLRDQQFVLLDFSGTRALHSLEGVHPALRVVEALPVKLPEDLRGVEALLVRPDAYVAWATAERPDVSLAMRAFEEGCGLEVPDLEADGVTA